jgi:hypothetical protein
MSGHTPGPWQSHDDQTTEGFVTIIANVEGQYVDGSPSYTYDTICVCEDEYGERLKEVAANVRLISAAPDLIKAIRESLEKLGEMEINPYNYDHDDVIRVDTNCTDAWSILDKALKLAGVS